MDVYPVHERLHYIGQKHGVGTYSGVGTTRSGSYPGVGATRDNTVFTYDN